MNEVREFLTQHSDLREPLALLGLFQGYVTAPVLSSLAEHEVAPVRKLDEQEWKRVLEEAKQCGLLERGEKGCYYIPTPVSGAWNHLLGEVYGGSRTQLDGVFCHTYAALAEKLNSLYGSDSRRALFYLRPEEQNLLQALRLASRLQRWSDARQLLLALEKLFTPAGHWKEWEYLTSEIDDSLPAATEDPALMELRDVLWRFRAEIARQHGEAEAEELYCQRRLDQTRPAVATAMRASLLKRLGRLASERGDREVAEKRFQECLALSVDDAAAQADLWHELALNAGKAGDFETADGCFRKSLALGRALRDLPRQGRTLLAMATTARAQGASAEAEQCYRQHLTLHEEHRDEAGQAEALLQLGLLALERQQWVEAEHWFRRSCQISKTRGEKAREANALLQLGETLSHRDKPEEAETCWRNSLALLVEAGDKSGQSKVLAKLGDVALKRKDLAQAGQWFTQARTLVEISGDPALLASVLDRLGNIAFLNGDMPGAEEHYRKSLGLRQQGGFKLQQAGLLYNLGLVAEQKKDLPSARECYQQSLALGHESKHEPTQMQALLQLARIAFQQGDLQEAENWCRASLHFADAKQDLAERAEIHYRLGRISAELCRPQEALASYCESLKLYEQLEDLPGYTRVLGRLELLARAEPELIRECFRSCLKLAEKLGATDQQLDVLLHLARLAENQEDWLEAEQWYQRCLGIQRATGDKSAQAYLLQKLGLILEEQGRPAEADHLFRQSVQLDGFPSGKYPFDTVVLQRLGHYSYQRKDYEDALLWYQQCLRVAEEIGDNLGMAQATFGLGKVALASGDFEHAENWFNQSLKFSKVEDHPEFEAQTLFDLGLLEAEREQVRSAEKHFRAALKLYERLQQPVRQAEVLVRLGQIAEDQGRAKRALECYRDAETLYQQIKDAQHLYLVRTAIQRVLKH